MDTVDAPPVTSLHNPPVAYPDLPPVGGKVGPEPEDFLVDEVPAYAASGKGEHQYVQVQKRLLTTPELVRRLAKASGVNERDVGYAGLKDKYAVTTQWLSLATKTVITPELALGEGVKILAVRSPTACVRKACPTTSVRSASATLGATCPTRSAGSGGAAAGAIASSKSYFPAWCSRSCSIAT